jgi:hypothetical protein
VLYGVEEIEFVIKEFGLIDFWREEELSFVEGE